MDVCKGPLIWYAVDGDYGDVNARRLAECEMCGEVMVLSDTIEPRHAQAPLIEDRRRV